MSSLSPTRRAEIDAIVQAAMVDSLRMGIATKSDSLFALPSIVIELLDVIDGEVGK